MSCGDALNANIDAELSLECRVRSSLRFYQARAPPAAVLADSLPLLRVIGCRVKCVRVIQSCCEKTLLSKEGLNVPSGEKPS